MAFIHDRKPKMKNIPAMMTMETMVSRRESDATFILAFETVIGVRLNRWLPTRLIFTPPQFPRVPIV